MGVLQEMALGFRDYTLISEHMRFLPLKALAKTHKVYGVRVGDDR